ncbi:MAG: hypothetical protein KJO11_11880 [Gemmatimonadetes bacterium]|nr:hypothetical protein [Gemmatimonadota bacterium]
MATVPLHPTGDRSSPVPPPGTHRFFNAAFSLPGRILVSWPLAGGLVAGGFLVAATTLSPQMTLSGVPQMTTLLFLVGAGAGLAHGALLGYLCHDPARTRVQVLRTMMCASVWVIPGLLLAWVATMWISLTTSMLVGSTPTILGMVWLGVSWLFGAAVLVWAALTGFQGIMAALRRWPGVRFSAAVTSIAFAVLLTLFLANPPEIWFTELRVTSVGAVFLAFGASVWITMPVVIVLYRLAQRVVTRRAS